MEAYSERLKKLDNNKLIDVVKNYRQYGYDEALRETAIAILNERGISKEHLQLSGEFENKTYDRAQELYSSFVFNSKIAFVTYSIVLVTNISLSIIGSNSESLALFIQLINWVAITLYVIFLVKAFMIQNQFYKAIGKEYGTEGLLFYLFFGMPFYFFMFFYFQDQMKGKMQEIK